MIQTILIKHDRVLSQLWLILALGYTGAYAFAIVILTLAGTLIMLL